MIDYEYKVLSDHCSFILCFEYNTSLLFKSSLIGLFLLKRNLVYGAKPSFGKHDGIVDT